MIICISGTHRNGKTTVAKEVAERMSFNFVETNVSSMELWKKIGSASSAVSFAERLFIQKEVFLYIKNIIEIRNSRPENIYILDRSPIDLIGYLLANIDYSCSSIFDEEVKYLIYEIQEFVHENIKKSYFLHLNHFIPFSPENGKDNKIYNSFGYRKAISNNILASHVEFIDDERWKDIFPNRDNEYAVNIILNDMIKLL